METKNMLYIVTEYATKGEMFGKNISSINFQLFHTIKNQRIRLYKIDLLFSLYV